MLHLHKRRLPSKSMKLQPPSYAPLQFQNEWILKRPEMVGENDIPESIRTKDSRRLFCRWRVGGFGKNLKHVYDLCYVVHIVFCFTRFSTQQCRQTQVLKEKTPLSITFSIVLNISFLGRSSHLIKISVQFQFTHHHLKSSVVGYKF